MLTRIFQKWFKSFQGSLNQKNDFINNGLFGYISYDSVRYFEKWPLLKDNSISIPDVSIMRYTKISLLSIILKMKRISFAMVGKSNISEIEQLLQSRNIASYINFQRRRRLFKFDWRSSNIMCFSQKALFEDVQLVLSRRFTQGFKGDEFNVYRALRSINPSPYLFFFDYGDF
jgi:anthranilate synthase component 1